jgi:hypothetical protein
MRNSEIKNDPGDLNDKLTLPFTLKTSLKRKLLLLEDIFALDVENCFRNF